MSAARLAAPIVVLGSGLAGWTTVRELRKLVQTSRRVEQSQRMVV